MKARSTRSGTISALIEPCRKKSRSPADQAGACAAATFATAGTLLDGRSPAAVQPAISSAMTTTAGVFMPSILRAPPRGGFQLFLQRRQDLASEALELRQLIVADEAHAEIGDAGLGIAAQGGDHLGCRAEPHHAAHVDAAAVIRGQ